MSDNIVEFPKKKSEPGEENAEEMSIYVCECESVFFFVTPLGVRCASPLCGEYFNSDNYEDL